MLHADEINYAAAALLFCKLLNIPVRGRDADCVCVHINRWMWLIAGRRGEGNVHACNCLPHLDIAGGERNKKMRLGYYRWCACNYTIKTTSDLSRQIPYPSLSLTRAARQEMRTPRAAHCFLFARICNRACKIESVCEWMWASVNAYDVEAQIIQKYRIILFSDNWGKKSWSLWIFLLTWKNS